MATATRVREFAMLRLIGARPGQVRAMMNGEARIVVFAALLIGLPAIVAITIALARGRTAR
jgi:putative ABC transport system permease protein